MPAGTGIEPEAQRHAGIESESVGLGNRQQLALFRGWVAQPMKADGLPVKFAPHDVLHRKRQVRFPMPGHGGQHLLVLPKVVVGVHGDTGTPDIEDDATGGGQFLRLRGGKGGEALGAQAAAAREQRDEECQRQDGDARDGHGG